MTDGRSCLNFPVPFTLALGVGIGTRDQDLFGSGLPTWRTRILLRVLGIETEE